MTVADTSINAYWEEVGNGTLVTERKKILFLLDMGKRMTSAEISKVTGMSRHNVASRLSDLKTDNLVIREGKEVCSVCDKLCYVWKSTGEIKL